jgi:hypothetical protein
LVGDFDTASSPDRLVRFIQRVEQRTGTTPVTYLENSDRLRASLSAASPAQKAVIRRSPYWIALYGPSGTERSMFTSRPLTPDGLTAKYGIWDQWSMWQYGGVMWQGGRSNPKHYNTGSWRSPDYFGNLARQRSERLLEPSRLRLVVTTVVRHGVMTGVRYSATCTSKNAFASDIGVWKTRAEVPPRFC